MALLFSMYSIHATAEEAILDETEAFVASPERGKAIFSSLCSHCHQTNYDESSIGAPGLQSVLERYDETWLSDWLKGPEAFAKVNVAAKDLISSNKFGLAMPTLPAMQDDEKRADTIAYLKTLK